MLIRRLESHDGHLRELADVFLDPAEAFICSPVSLTMRQLVDIYMDAQPEEERHTLPRIYRKRSRDERWMEKRAVYQARRVAAKRDAILNSEAEVWAIIGLEFHSRRIRSLWERWETLDYYTTDLLEKCEEGKMQFTTALRDACRELREIETKLEEIMPTLGIPERAQKKWTAKSGGREETIERITGALASIAGSEKAGQVFEMVRLEQADALEVGSSKESKEDE